VAQADAIVSGGTGPAAHAADEHRYIAHEGRIHKRRHCKVFIAVVLGSGNRIAIVTIAAAGENAGNTPSFLPLAEAAVEGEALGLGTHVPDDRAYSTRETTARAVITVKINSSGKSMGFMEWRRHVVANPVPPEMRRKFTRGDDVQSLPLEVRVKAQKGWMEENGYGQHPLAARPPLGGRKRGGWRRTSMSGAPSPPGTSSGRSRGYLTGPSRRAGWTSWLSRWQERPKSTARRARSGSARRGGAPNPAPRASRNAGTAAQAAGAPAKTY